MANEVVHGRRENSFRVAMRIFLSLLQDVGIKGKYKPDGGERNVWEKFMQEFGTNIGEDFIRQFAQFGFNYYFGDGQNRYTVSVRFNWIFGSGMIGRWKKAKSKAQISGIRKSISRGLKSRYRLNTRRKNEDMTRIVTEVREIEEKFKSEFLNTKRGLPWCVANTTLYNHRSRVCLSCIYKSDCKEVLKTEYPGIWKTRGYGER